VHRRAAILASLGVDVRVLVAGDPLVTAYDGIATRRVGVARHALLFALPSFIAAARDVDLVHTFSYHAALPAYVAARLMRKPVVCEYLGLFGPGWSMMRPPAVAWAYRSFERLLVRIPFDANIYLSETSRRLANDDGPRAIVVPPGVDPPFFNMVAPEQKEDLVLFAGKFEKRKGIEEVLAVARACSEIRFAAVGWGPDTGTFASAAPSNLQVVIGRGPLESLDAYRDMLGRARVFFFPSFAESFGIVVAEAMARGCAIISSTSHDFRGVHVEAGRTEQMVDAVRMLWQDRETSLAWGAENRVLARKYDWAAGCESVLRLYHKLLREHATRRKP